MKKAPKRFEGGGLAPYGLRNADSSPKGKGYFGALKSAKGEDVTELSSEADDLGEYPLVVPTLTKKELDHLLAGKKPTEEIYEKAESWAKSRKDKGKSAYIEQSELRSPVPKKKGGTVSSVSRRADGIAKRGKTRGKYL